MSFGIVDITVALVILWVLPWKIAAVVKAYRRKEPVWVAVLLFVNTIAVLEILYLYVFSKKKISHR